MFIRYIDDYKDLVEELKYDIHLIAMVIEFIELKLDDYVNYKKSIDDANNINDNKTLIEMSYNERVSLFKYTMLNTQLCGGYISEMVLVHIYIVIEEYLNKICSLLVIEKEIKCDIKKIKCSIERYRFILDSKNIINANKKYFKDLDALRKIRNAIVHNRKKIKNKDVESVSKYVYIDDMNYVSTNIDTVKRFFVLFEKYISTIFQEMNLLIKE
ncbi:hypothetical protein FDB28_16115 [Clostridium botulinum]|nr:hypothetical protein [Clostridium botulinum]NFS97435.1 hypothetical protein [Clostridium botulinum]